MVGNDVIFLHGASAGASPWCTEPRLAPPLAIALSGMSRTRRFGRPVAIAVCLLWMYISVATYIARLIPLYGGYPGRCCTLREILRWYAPHGADLSSILSTLSLALPAMIYIETVVVTGLAIALRTRLTRAVHRSAP